MSTRAATPDDPRHTELGFFALRRCITQRGGLASDHSRIRIERRG